ncbi:hypothetical protein EPN52_13625 [bacterium]|nr:MAG: hypothetical protein EPN52_13625 [bacterium]
MTGSEIAGAAVEAKARVRAAAERALQAIEAAARGAQEAVRELAAPPEPSPSSPGLAEFEIEGLDEPLFDESETFGQAEE